MVNVNTKKVQEKIVENTVSSSEKKPAKQRLSSQTVKPSEKQSARSVKRQPAAKKTIKTGSKKSPIKTSQTNTRTKGVNKKKPVIKKLSKKVSKEGKVHKSGRGIETKQMENQEEARLPIPATNGQKVVPIVAIKNYLMSFLNG